MSRNDALNRAERTRKHHEAVKELENFQRHWPALRDVITPQAAMVAWLTLGDDMWVKPENKNAKT